MQAAQSVLRQQLVQAWSTAHQSAIRMCALNAPPLLHQCSYLTHAKAISGVHLLTLPQTRPLLQWVPQGSGP